MRMPVCAEVCTSLSLSPYLQTLFSSHTPSLSSELTADFIASTMAAIAVFGILFGKNNNYLWLFLVRKEFQGHRIIIIQRFELTGPSGSQLGLMAKILITLMNQYFKPSR